MDRYIVANNPGGNAAGNAYAGGGLSGDLLSMLAQENPDSGQSSAWAAKENQSIANRACNSVLLKKQEDVKGWKNVNGSRQYTTYRNGSRVTAQGQEAFRLALGDSKAGKKANGAVDAHKNNIDLGSKNTSKPTNEVNERRKPSHFTAPASSSVASKRGHTQADTIASCFKRQKQGSS